MIGTHCHICGYKFHGESMYLTIKKRVDGELVKYRVCADCYNIYLSKGEQMQFFKDINYRDGKGSSKKWWFNIACLTATIILLWICYKDNMEDYAFIALFSIYLTCLGGFEVIPKILAMVLEFKTGKKVEVTNADSVDIK